MNLFDQFLATQGRMAQNDALAMDNKLTLAKIGQIDRANKMKDDTLAMYKTDAQPKVTLANMSEMRDVPDANLESQGKPAQEPVTPPPKQRSAAEQLMDAASEADRLAKKLQTVNPTEADKQRRERDNILTKAAPLLKEERLAKIEESNAVNQWMGAVKDDVSLNAIMSQIQQQKPEMFKAWADMKLPNGAPAFPRNLDGSFAYNPQTKAIAESVSNASMKRSEQLQAEDRLADNKQKELEFEQKKRVDEANARHQRATEANAREGNQIRREELDVRREEKGAANENKQAVVIRREQDKALKPLDEVQQKVTKSKELLAQSTPAADLQLQMELTNVFDKARATNMLFSANKNFGSIAGRVEGMIGRAFTGQYTDAQRGEILKMLNGMESDVITPARQKVSDHYGRLAEKSGVSKDLVETPNFYGSAASNPQAEADAFFAAMKKGQPSGKP